MAHVKWPNQDQRAHIGKRISRLDGPVKTTGTAKYSYDIARPGLLYAKLVASPHAHAQVVSINLAPAQSLPGVKAVWKDDELIGQEVKYAGTIVAAVAAVTEEIATEAANRIQVQYKPLDHQVLDSDPALATGRESKREAGNLEKAFADAAAVVSGEYGLPSVAHCCFEAHGQVTEIRDGELHIWATTQNVSRYSDRLGESVGIPQNKIHVDCQHMGGGFGSKFSHDKWCVIGTLLSKQAGQPVKLMLPRDLDIMIAGNRPSARAKIKVAGKKDGTITAFDAEIWGTGGAGGYSPPPLPYVLTKIPNTRTRGRGISTHRGSQRAWRAPNHPQACFLTMSAVDDLAAALKIDPLEFFLHNMNLTDRPDVYREELNIAADLVGYKQKAHPRGDPTPGPIKRGLGISVHTWGGLGHASECDVTLHPDGSVDVQIGTQDLGVGTRTAIAIVVAETLGLPLDAVQVHIGKSDYPVSGASGGSTTIGGVSTSSRTAATEALNALLAIVAPKLNAQPDQLEARDGKIRVAGNPDHAMSWKDACAMLGPNPLTKRGACNPPEAQKAGLIDANVGGAQIADVSVDIQTGVVTINQMVAVQDCGTIVNLKTAESQAYGALIMGITYALFEETIYDQATGRLLNADMEFYRLAGLKDIGQLKVHLMTSPNHDRRGIIGIGEPPVVSPGAAISNAVANACGVRVPELPLTPDRVINALQKGGILS